MNFRDEVIQLLAKTASELYGTDPAVYNGDTRFNEDLNAKSTDIVRFTTTLEDEYDVEVPFMAFRRSKTFAEAAAFMSDLTGFE